MELNYLLLKPDEQFTESDELLFPPYRNIIANLEQIATRVDSGIGVLDSVRKMYDGIEGLRGDRSYFHSKALLETTSYYQASKGGRGKYLEKVIASYSKQTGIDFEVKNLPKILAVPALYRKSKLKGAGALTRNERNLLSNEDIPWSGSNTDNKKIDMYRIEDGKLIFLELKNRVDSGGDGARQEFYHKFTHLLKLILDDTAIYNKKDSFSDYLRRYGINEIRFSGGLLFNLDGGAASLEDDVFFASNRREFRRLVQELRAYPNVRSLRINEDDVTLECEIKRLKIHVSCNYGNDVIKEITGKGATVSELLGTSYADLALIQRICIYEREVLLRNKGTNSLTLLRKAYEQYTNLERLLVDFIKLPSKDNLSKIITELNYNHEGLLNNIRKMISQNFYSINSRLDEYIAELIISECLFRRSR